MVFRTFLLFITIVFVTTQVSFSQTIPWEKDALTWNDFKAPAVDSSDQNSNLVYYISYQEESLVINDTILERIRVDAVMDCDSSWVRSEHKTEQFLSYNQVIFDIAELYRRKAQYMMNRAVYYHQIDSIYHAMLLECRNRTESFKLASENGKMDAVVHTWSDKIEIEISSFPATQGIPEIKPRLFAYGMSVALGYGRYSGSLGDAFTGFPMFALGFEMALGKPVLSVMGSIGLSQMKNIHDFDGTIIGNGTLVIPSVIAATIDYPVIQNDKHRLAPFLGIGVFQNSFPEEDSIALTLNDYCPLFVVVYERRMRTAVSLIPMQKVPGVLQSNETHWQFKLYLSPVQFTPELSGLSLNLSVGFLWMNRKFWLKNQKNTALEYHFKVD
ncbi:MAG: hypothetical protein C0592_07980 [Marinilabiliales bacterium]|nr:MAG: hypothetical protein C0592_07980 [Marinilabiliales bacterium]